MQLKLYEMILVLLLISLANQAVAGQDVDMMSIGLRAGMNDNRNDEDFSHWSIENSCHYIIDWNHQDGKADATPSSALLRRRRTVGDYNFTLGRLKAGAPSAFADEK